MRSRRPSMALFVVACVSLSCSAPVPSPQQPPAASAEIPVVPVPDADATASATSAGSAAPSRSSNGWSDAGAKGFPVGRWQGECGEPGPSWAPLRGHLVFTATGEVLRAQGKLTFVGRKTNAHLEGRLEGNHFRMRGTLEEPDALKTKWSVEVTVEAPRGDASPLRVSIEELTSDPTSPASHMCSFRWAAASPGAP